MAAVVAGCAVSLVWWSCLWILYVELECMFTCALTRSCCTRYISLQNTQERLPQAKTQLLPRLLAGERATSKPGHVRERAAIARVSVDVRPVGAATISRQIEDVLGGQFPPIPSYFS
jgi:hypothetical protein